MIKITTKTGNLLHVTSGHVVHGCNAQGVMGSGVALGIKETYPAAYDDYKRIHTSGFLELGDAHPVMIGEDLVIWNAITQDLYGLGVRQVSYDAIESCFVQINATVKIWDRCAKMIHIPKIGAARGGGNWEIIREIIEQTVEYPVTLWLPDSTVTTI